MDSIGRQTGIYPSLPLADTSLLPDTRIRPVVGVKYHNEAASSFPFTDLQNRLVIHVPAAGRYSSHSPVVNHLLQQGHLLQQQFRSVQGIAAYAEFVNKIPCLNNWLNEGVVPSSLPFNPFSQLGDHTLHDQRGASAYNQPLSSYLNKQSGVFHSAAHLLKPYQPLFNLYGDILRQRISVNHQKVLFQGYPFPRHNNVSQLYPLNDLLNYSYWLSSPSDYPWSPVRGYVSDRPEFWPEQAGGFLAPRESQHNGFSCFAIHELDERESQLYRNPLWESMLKYLGPFGHSVSQEDREKSRIEEPATKRRSENKKLEEREPLDDESVIGGDERLAETVTPLVHHSPALNKGLIKSDRNRKAIASLQQDRKRLETEAVELIKQQKKANHEAEQYREKSDKLGERLWELEQQLVVHDEKREAEASGLKSEILALKQQLAKQKREPVKDQLHALEKKLKDKELVHHQEINSGEGQALQKKIQVQKLQRDKAEQDVIGFKQESDKLAKAYKKLIAQREAVAQEEQGLNEERIKTLEAKVVESKNMYDKLVAEHKTLGKKLNENREKLSETKSAGNDVVDHLKSELQALTDLLHKAKKEANILRKERGMFAEEQKALLEKKDDDIRIVQDKNKEKIDALRKQLKDLEKNHQKSDHERDKKVKELDNQVFQLNKKLQTAGERENSDAERNKLQKALEQKKQELDKQLAVSYNNQLVLKKEINKLKSELKKATHTADQLRQERGILEKEKISLIVKREESGGSRKEEEQKEIQVLKKTIQDLNSEHDHLICEKDRDIADLQHEIKKLERNIQSDIGDNSGLRREVEVKKQELDKQKKLNETEGQQMRQKLASLTDKLEQAEKERALLQEQLQKTKTRVPFVSEGSRKNTRQNEGHNNTHQIGEVKEEIATLQANCLQVLKEKEKELNDFCDVQGVNIDRAKNDVMRFYNELKIRCKLLNDTQKASAEVLIKEAKDCFNSLVCKHKGEQKKQRDDLSSLGKQVRQTALLASQSDSLASIMKAKEEFFHLNKKIMTFERLSNNFDVSIACEPIEKVEQTVFSWPIQEKRTESLGKVSESKPLESAIVILRQGDFTPRERLQNLFDSSIGLILAGRENLEVKNKKLYKKNPIQKMIDSLEEFTSSIGGKREGKLDTRFMREFIQVYKESIEQEVKLKAERSYGAHQEKKECRLKAVEQIERFLNEENKNHSSYKQNCLLACQILMRIREPSFVCQDGTPRCGGFAVMQHAWRERPDIVTRVLLSFHLRGKANVTALGGKEIQLKTASKYRLNQSNEALADDLLVSSFYPSGQEGSNAFEDLYVGYFLGLNPKVYQSQGALDNSGRQAFLELLEKISIGGGSIGLGVGGIFSHKLSKIMARDTIDGFTRKASLNKYEPLQITELARGSNSRHHILFDGFRFDRDRVYIKIYTWGSVRRYSMDKDEFFRHISAETVLIYPGKNNKHLEGIESPKPEMVISRSKGKQEYIDCYGNRENLSPGVLYKGKVTGCPVYHRDGIMTFLRPSEDENVVWLNDGCDVAMWNKSIGGEEQIVKRYMGRDRILINRHGDVRYFIKGVYVKGFSNTYYKLDDDGAIYTKVTKSP